MNNFINLNANDQLSSMDKKDLNEFLRLLNNYDLELREKLDCNNITFGMELECEHVNIKPILESLKEINFVHKWLVEPDESLIDTNGLEFISPTYKNSPFVNLNIKCSYNIQKLIKLNNVFSFSSIWAPI